MDASSNVVMFKIKLKNIPKNELRLLFNNLFNEQHNLIDGDTLTASLKTTYSKNEMGNEVPMYSIVVNSEFDAQKSDLMIGSINEYGLSRYRAFLKIIEDERLADDDFIFFEGFEKKDIERITYIEIQMRGITSCLGREHCDFIFNTLRSLDPKAIDLTSEDKKNVVTNVPSKYFNDGSTPIVPETGGEAYMLISKLKYLTGAGVLKEGTLSLEYRTMLTKDERAYMDWLEDRSAHKPILDVYRTDNARGLFKKIFKKSAEKDLSLEF